MMRVAMLILALAAAAGAGEGPRATVTGRYIIKLKPSAGVADVQQRVQGEIEKRGGRVVETLSGVMKALIVDSDEKTIARIRRMPGVEMVKADRKVPVKPLPKPENPKS